MSNRLTFYNWYHHPRFWRHALVWILFFVFGFLLQQSDPDGLQQLTDENIRELRSAFLVLVILIYTSFYAYNRLIPGQRYWAFALSIVLIIIATSYIDEMLDTGIMQMGGITGFWANIVIFPIVLLMAFGFKLSYHGTRQLFRINKLEAEQTESQLKLLKSQVNPHFLFNTLNNIYATNLTDQDMANEIILELADLLRYQLESNRQKYVPLSDEITSLENYIHIEQIRVRECSVSIKKEGDFSQAQIIPLLLLPFVENAFKYGTGIQPGEIDLVFEISDQRLFHFYCKNRIVQKAGKVHSGGIGLQNVRKRLEIIYPTDHQLTVEQENGYYIIDLLIQL